MREILFRGKRKLGNEWIEGSLHTEKFTDDEEFLCCEVCQCDVYPETVGQYTGLTDKNGKRIFEGDIVKNEYEKGHYQYFKIFYCNRTYMWQGENKYGMLSKVYQMLGTLEVIGNIHDNPELLEGGRQ